MNISKYGFSLHAIKQEKLKHGHKNRGLCLWHTVDGMCLVKFQMSFLNQTLKHKLCYVNSSHRSPALCKAQFVGVRVLLYWLNIPLSFMGAEAMSLLLIIIYQEPGIVPGM